jgi:hypothetical protein
MKPYRLLSKTGVLLAVASLLIHFAGTGSAAAQTNNPQSSAAVDTNATAGVMAGENGSKPVLVGNLGSDNVLGLPRETLDRLPPDQIVELLRMKQSHPGDVVPIVATAVPIFLFAAMVIIVALVIFQRLKKTRMLHETLRAMIEKGTPIPPELLRPQAPQRRPKSDLRSGLVLIGIGIALIIAFYHLGGVPRGLGLIPLLMGVAFLITWKLEPNKTDDSK